VSKFAETVSSAASFALAWSDLALAMMRDNCPDDPLPVLTEALIRLGYGAFIKSLHWTCPIKIACLPIAETHVVHAAALLQCLIDNDGRGGEAEEEKALLRLDHARTQVVLGVIFLGQKKFAEAAETLQRLYRVSEGTVSRGNGSHGNGSTGGGSDGGGNGATRAAATGGARGGGATAAKTARAAASAKTGRAGRAGLAHATAVAARAGDDDEDDDDHDAAGDGGVSASWQQMRTEAHALLHLANLGLFGDVASEKCSRPLRLPLGADGGATAEADEHTPGGLLKYCGRCKVTPYCSERCQKLHWPIHKQACGCAIPLVPSTGQDSGDNYQDTP
jgi:hypothetical protein